MQIVIKIAEWVKENPKTAIFIAGVLSAFAIKFLF
jgi:hypothetical protein